MDVSFFAAPALFYRNVTKSFPDLHEVSLVCGDKSHGCSLGQYQLSLGVPGSIVYLWGSSNLFFLAPYDFNCLCCFDEDDKACLAIANHSHVLKGDIVELNLNTGNFYQKQIPFVFSSDYEEDLARVVSGANRLIS